MLMQVLALLPSMEEEYSRPWAIAALCGFIFFLLFVPVLEFKRSFIPSAMGLSQDRREEMRMSVFLLEAVM